ncbi:hypothetical protein niasHS_004536 [Heterodera schachtii]|uniref:Transmembrane protein n=1 Tax=Heterodera schachtii TaxID=97005 RepID=A0ABD2JMF4_HETSC
MFLQPFHCATVIRGTFVLSAQLSLSSSRPIRSMNARSVAAYDRTGHDNIANFLTVVMNTDNAGVLDAGKRYSPVSNALSSFGQNSRLVVSPLRAPFRNIATPIHATQVTEQYDTTRNSGAQVWTGMRRRMIGVGGGRKSVDSFFGEFCLSMAPCVIQTRSVSTEGRELIRAEVSNKYAEMLDKWTNFAYFAISVFATILIGMVVRFVGLFWSLTLGFGRLRDQIVKETKQ